MWGTSSKCFWDRRHPFAGGAVAFQGVLTLPCRSYAVRQQLLKTHSQFTEMRTPQPFSFPVDKTGFGIRTCSKLYTQKYAVALSRKVFVSIAVQPSVRLPVDCTFIPFSPAEHICGVRHALCTPKTAVALLSLKPLYVRSLRHMRSYLVEENL